MKKHKAQKEREEGEFQYSGSDDEAQPETDERAGEPSSILQVDSPIWNLPWGRGIPVLSL
jgi:hypothetical protein